MNTIQTIKNYIKDNNLNENEHKLIVPLTLALQLCDVKMQAICGFQYKLDILGTTISHINLKG